jgi:REP element-mobilizing transposase RayT
VGDAALGVPPSGPLGVPHIELSEIGKIVEHFIVGIGDMLDAYVIMPNHVHMILIVDSGIGTLPVAVGGTSPAAVGGTSPTAVGGTPRAASPTKAVIPKIVNSFKGLASKKAGFALWQRSYYDHIIRSETDYARILEYIENNPLKWKLDSLYMEE